MKNDHLLEPILEILLDRIERKGLDAIKSGTVETLLNSGIITEEDLDLAKAKYFGCEVLELQKNPIPPEIIACMSAEQATHYGVVPVAKKDGKLIIAISDPSDLDVIDQLHHLLQEDLTIAVASSEDIEWALRFYYKRQSKESSDKLLAAMISNGVGIT